LPILQAFNKKDGSQGLARELLPL